MSSMSSAIGGISSLMGRIGGIGQTQRFDPSSMVDQVFSKIDTQGKGYLDATDFQAAFEQISSKVGSKLGAGVEKALSVLDGDGDGKISSTELSDRLTTLVESLGVIPGMDGKQLPSAAENEVGFTKDELTRQLAGFRAADQPNAVEIPRVDFLTNLLREFDATDSDGDGRVNFDEIMTLGQQSSQGIGSGETDTFFAGSHATASNATSESDNAKLMRTIMQLMHAYDASGQESDATESLSVSV